MLVSDLRLVLDEFKLTQVELAKLVGVTPRAVNMWMQGDREIPGPVEAYVRLFILLPAQIRDGERARAAGKEKIMKEGFYRIQFQTAGEPSSWGVGTLVFDGGKIFGVDEGGAKYDGEYVRSANLEMVDVTLKVAFPPNAMSIFGIVHPYEWSIEVRTQLDPKKDGGLIVATTNVGPQVLANYEFVRSMPEAA
jgi:Helix-turn-helix